MCLVRHVPIFFMYILCTYVMCVQSQLFMYVMCVQSQFFMYVMGLFEGHEKELKVGLFEGHEKFYVRHVRPASIFFYIIDFVNIKN